MSPHGVHAREQTAFRLPPALLARLRTQAETEERTMTAIVIDAIDAYLAVTVTQLSPGNHDQGTP